MFAPEFAFKTENGIGFKAIIITADECGEKFVWVPNDSPMYDKALALYEKITA